MAECEIISSIDQYGIVQKLYDELEKEREASATAANEALSMILRLQAEKAAEKMEASQYKRMTEEKIHHAEESLADIEEALYQRDKEIASLKFQIQRYRNRLLTTGITNSICPEISNASMDNTSFVGNARQNSPWYASRYADQLYKDIFSEEAILPLKRPTNKKSFDTSISNMNNWENSQGFCDSLSDSPLRGCYFCCNHVEGDSLNVEDKSKLRIIKEDFRANCTVNSGPPMSILGKSLHLGLGHRLHSSYSAHSRNPFYDPTVQTTEDMHDIEGTVTYFSESDFENSQDGCSPYSYLETELPINEMCSVRFNDIFEVTECQKDHNAEEKNKPSKDHFPERMDTSVMAYSVPKKAGGNCFIEKEKANKPLLDGKCNTKFLASRKGMHHNYKWGAKEHKDGISFSQDVGDLWQSDFQQLKNRLQVLEDERRIVKYENCNAAEEQMKLLREISEQLNTINSQMRRRQFKKQSHRDETKIVSFMEAMLCFSI